MTLENLKNVYVGEGGFAIAGEADTEAQTTTNSAVVLAGTELDTRAWKWMTWQIKNTGGTNAGKYRIRGSNMPDLSEDEQITTADLAAGANVEYNLPSLSDGIIKFRYIWVTVESTAAGDHTTMKAHITGKRI